MGFWRQKEGILFSLYLLFFKEMLILSYEFDFTEEVPLELGLYGCVGVSKGRRAILRNGTSSCGGLEE